MIIGITIPDLKPILEQGIRDVLLLNIGSLWIDYCEKNIVDPRVENEGVKFLEDFAKKLNEQN